MRVIGITGGIGSGKTFLCNILASQFAIPLFNCDSEAQTLMASDPGVRLQLCQLISQSLFLPTGKLDTALKASYLYATPRTASRVASVVHPPLRQRLRQWIASQTAPIVAVESAILCEAGFDSEVTELLCVTAPRKARLQRAMGRSGATRQAVLAIMAAQRPRLALAKAKHILHNPPGTTTDTITSFIKHTLLC